MFTSALNSGIISYKKIINILKFVSLPFIILSLSNCSTQKNNPQIPDSLLSQTGLKEQDIDKLNSEIEDCCKAKVNQKMEVDISLLKKEIRNPNFQYTQTTGQKITGFFTKVQKCSLSTKQFIMLFNSELDYRYNFINSKNYMYDNYDNYKFYTVAARNFGKEMKSIKEIYNKYSSDSFPNGFNAYLNYAKINLPDVNEYFELLNQFIALQEKAQKYADEIRNYSVQYERAKRAEEIKMLNSYPDEEKKYFDYSISEKSLNNILVYSKLYTDSTFPSFDTKTIYPLSKIESGSGGFGSPTSVYVIKVLQSVPRGILARGERINSYYYEIKPSEIFFIETSREFADGVNIDQMDLVYQGFYTYPSVLGQKKVWSFKEINCTIPVKEKYYFININDSHDTSSVADSIKSNQENNRPESYEMSSYGINTLIRSNSSPFIKDIVYPLYDDRNYNAWFEVLQSVPRGILAESKDGSIVFYIETNKEFADRTILYNQMYLNFQGFFTYPSVLGERKVFSFKEVSKP